jgi:membrane protein insertase Oxa1/YidC/SpoIIIJ
MNSRKENGNNPHVFIPRRSPAVMKGVLIALFILTFFTLPAGLALEASRTTFSSTSTDYAWMLFLLLPIPLANLILGVIYKIKGLKTTKNIVVGIIFTFFLCAYGSFTFIFSGFYSHNLSYIDNVASEVHFNLPDKGHITT